ncbi:hypothetical protein Q7472_10430 [Glaesserella parasuis]|uniref:hypothetical protein n=1 Tax=Glaesserella parasuis TaxID=738 RepID=UPI0013666CAC|nr:hypothetical protein [Glaesserella parasuis]MDG6355795.1 hypothetical protein [Glaesserella parasuis]MDO9674865.1 hypothetical protein [Glaesserella parasuis]MDO9748395.1 hypothetical protein [Glaesserella parasuis]MDO9772656.1 hypothetical protein [Glaesserella parasuis]MDO9774753.1 hypothetical protein [Glaesserella parasuis]
MYGKLKQISKQLIQKFGSPCLIKTQISGQYDPATGKMQTEIRKQNAYCLFDNLAYDFPSFQSGGTSRGEAVAIEQGDVVIYLTEKAEVGSAVEVNGEVWSIIAVQPIKPANVAMLYQCQGRKQ